MVVSIIKCAVILFPATVKCVLTASIGFAMLKQTLKPPNRPNPECMYCYTGVPPDVISKTDEDHARYWCPECDSTLLNELRFEGTGASVPFGLTLPHELQAIQRDGGIVSEDSSCEIHIFWGGRRWSAVVAGEHVLGDRSVTKYAVELLSYDSISY